MNSILQLLAASPLGSAQELNIPTILADENSWATILNTIFLLAGAIAVVFVVWGGILYVTSGGSPDQVQRAKNTVMYAVIGLIVSVLAVTIVSFIVGSFS